MRLRGLKVTYLSCFAETEVPFSHRTVIVGANNTGKTSLLGLPFIGATQLKAHQAGARPDTNHGRAKLEFEIEVLFEEMKLEQSHQRFSMTCHSSNPDPIAGLRTNPMVMHIERSPSTGEKRRLLGTEGHDCTVTYDFVDGQWVEVQRRNAIEGAIGDNVFAHFMSNTFHLTGRRNPVEKLKPAIVSLTPDATNLVQVLDLLQSKPSRFQRFVDYVREVLPEIQRITVRAAGGGEKQVLISESPDEDAQHLTFPLASAGAGTAQVLALIYILSEARAPSVVLLDEPSVHLHPGALRQLFRLMMTVGREHQYIIATHNLSGITELVGHSVVVLQKEAGQASTARALATQRIEEHRFLLESVGASLADVLSAERVVWIEGPTECDVFSRLLNLEPELAPSRGLIFLPLVSTGDLSRKDGDRIVEIYQRLSTMDFASSRTIAFVLDTEGRSAETQELFRKRLKVAVHFTPGGVMLENTFLDASIVRGLFLANQDAWATSPPPISEIEKHWSTLHGGKYSTSAVFGTAADQWRREVHGANVLADTISHFTEERAAYDKRAHGVALLEIAQHSTPTILEGLRELLRALVR
jgi:energy-coupling factor transporter ATP-binding protein EcfA2